MTALLVAVALLGGGPAERVYDLMNLEEIEALARRVSESTLRVESERRPQGIFTLMEDGAAVHLGAGRLLTTARYLGDAEKVTAVTRGGARIPLTIVERDAEADLALLQAPPGTLASVPPIPGTAAFPLGTSGAEEVVLPVSLLGPSVSLRRAVTGRDDAGYSLVTGTTANGVPLFDVRGRLVGLSRQPTPDLARTLVVPGETILAWMAGAPGGGQAGADGKETGPRTEVREPGGP